MTYNTNVMEEIYFWSEIMSDHAEFMIMFFSPREPELANTAQQFKNTFINIRNEAKGYIEASKFQPSVELTNKVLPVLISFINFKNTLMKRLLQCNVELRLPPSYINHMINEAMDFHSILCIPQANTPINPVIENINLNKAWLIDASAHAVAIASNIDPIETTILRESLEFKNSFDQLFIKTIELGSMLERTNIDNGVLHSLNEEAEYKVKELVRFLYKVKELLEKCKVIMVIKPILPDHMIREANYYLSRLQKFKCM